MDSVDSKQMALLLASISQPLSEQKVIFDNLNLNVTEFAQETVENIIHDIDDDIWISIINIACGDESVFGVVKVEARGQAGGFFTDFYGFYRTSEEASRSSVDESD